MSNVFVFHTWFNLAGAAKHVPQPDSRVELSQTHARIANRVYPPPTTLPMGIGTDPRANPMGYPSCCCRVHNRVAIFSWDTDGRVCAVRIRPRGQKCVNPHYFNNHAISNYALED